MHHPRCFDCIDDFNVAESSVLVTGAAHGLGLAMATAFVGAGARVAFLDRASEPLETAVLESNRCGTAFALEADVRNEQQVARAIETAVVAFGGLDILINNAAIYPVIAFQDSSAAELMDVMDINVGGYARAIHGALPYLKRSGSGRIINIASTTFMFGHTDMSAYVASKGAVIGLTRVLATELGRDGITVNAI